MLKFSDYFFWLNSVTILALISCYYFILNCVTFVVFEFCYNLSLKFLSSFEIWILSLFRFWVQSIFNRFGVAGAVLQSPPSLINSLSRWPFSFKPSKHHYTQTVRARELKFWENVHPPTTCQLLFFFFLGGGGQSGGAIQLRVCYQWGLPRLVFLVMI